MCHNETSLRAITMEPWHSRARPLHTRGACMPQQRPRAAPQIKVWKPETLYLLFTMADSRKKESRSVVSDSLPPHELYPTRLLCPWNPSGKNTGMGCHSLLQGIFLTQGLNPGLLHYRQILYCLTPGKPWQTHGGN